MRFIKARDWSGGAAKLGAELAGHLRKAEHVLWLLSGGSNMPISVTVMDTLDDQLTENLTILLIDERYGLPGHKDSNYKQLLDAGFNHKQATFMPALVEGLTLAETAQRYDDLVGRALDRADTVIAQLGIGADGHISGILPHSPAVAASGLVTYYTAEPYERLTTTFEALRQIDVDYSFVFGADKLGALEKLQGQNLDLKEQPSQILKELTEAYVYNDLIGKETS